MANRPAPSAPSALSANLPMHMVNNYPTSRYILRWVGGIPGQCRPVYSERFCELESAGLISKDHPGALAPMDAFALTPTGEAVLAAIGDSDRARAPRTATLIDCAEHPHEAKVTIRVKFVDTWRVTLSRGGNFVSAARGFAVCRESSLPREVRDAVSIAHAEYLEF